MSRVMAVQKVVLGETWSLPLGVAVALAVAAGRRALSGAHGWWRGGGGFVLLALVICALVAASPLARGGRRGRRRARVPATRERTALDDDGS